MEKRARQNRRSALVFGIGTRRQVRGSVSSLETPSGDVMPDRNSVGAEIADKTGEP